MSDDLQSAYFRELVDALKSSTSVMATVSEKLLSVERSIESLDEGLGELAKALKNGRLQEIVNAVRDHDFRTKDLPGSCIEAMDENVRLRLKEVLSSREYEAFIQSCIKAQMDPSDPKKLTPVSMKEKLAKFEWRDWVNGRVFVVGGFVALVIELIIKYW